MLYAGMLRGVLALASYRRTRWCQNEMEELRKELYNMTGSFTSEKMLEISRWLDKYVVACQKEKLYHYAG